MFNFYWLHLQRKHDAELRYFRTFGRLLRYLKLSRPRNFEIGVVKSWSIRGARLKARIPALSVRVDKGDAITIRSGEKNG